MTAASARALQGRIDRLFDADGDGRPEATAAAVADLIRAVAALEERLQETERRLQSALDYQAYPENGGA